MKLEHKDVLYKEEEDVGNQAGDDGCEVPSEPDLAETLRFTFLMLLAKAIPNLSPI